ncbi:galactokinase [Maribacter sp. MMG018]|nr:galactokinase [Maribacter sp. MMG018]
MSPGRTCLFGDHQDYLGLPVVACAIDRQISLTARPNGLDSFVINMQDIGKKRVISISDMFTELEPRDYFGSALRVLRRRGCVTDQGYDVHITGNIPINSGNSSSSAVLLAWIYFLVEAFGVDDTVDKDYLAELAYSAEVLEHNEPGGMMDHFSIAVGGIVKIKTSRPYKCQPIKSNLNGMVSGVSGVPKETVGLLSRVKGSALKSIEIVKKEFPGFDLAKAGPDDLKAYRKVLPQEFVPYFEGAIENHHITQLALKELEKTTPDLKVLGDLMNQHHVILKDKLQITVPKIDAMISAALDNGAYGAKIVGSGGGGSIVAITEPGTEDKIIEAMLGAGAKDAYAISVDPGLRTFA